MYGGLKRNAYLFIAQQPGIALSLFYTLTSLRLLGAGMARERALDAGARGSIDPLASRGAGAQRKGSDSESGSDDAEGSGDEGALALAREAAAVPPSRMQMYMEVLIMSSIVGSAVFIGALASLAKLEVAQLETWTGYLCNAFAIGFMSSPLATMASVIRTRNAASLDAPLSAMILLNGLFWVAYGFATNDCASRARCAHFRGARAPRARRRPASARGPDANAARARRARRGPRSKT